ENVIIVTANKREQNLQEIPVAISALSSETIELQGITQTQDLSGLAPNVAVNGGTTNATASVITIRGIPTNADETQGFDSPIGLYLDGVYLARSSASSFEVADIERIEVLRGPQGTLFGRNTTGGAVNFITKAPSEDASAKVKLGYGNYNQKQARLILNSGTIFDSGRISLGYLYKKRNGVVDNLLQPNKSLDPGGNETHAARLAIELDITDNLKLTNITDWSKIDGVPHANQLSAVGDGVFRPNITIDGNTFAQVQPANVGGYLANAAGLEAQCGTPLANVQRARLDPICLEGAGLSTDTLRGNMTRLELDLDTVTVRSTTAFRGWKNTIRGSDLDGLGTISGPIFAQTSTFNGLPAAITGFLLPPFSGAANPTAQFLQSQGVPTTNQPLFQARNDREQSQFSQEIEIVGGSGTNFEWVVGGFYFRETGSETNPQTFAFVLDTNQAVFSDANFGPNFGPGLRAANTANGTQFRAVVQQSTLAYNVKGESYAIYGQGTFRPGGEDGALGVTLGLRYSWDKKEMTVSQNGAVPFGTPAELALNSGSAKFSEPTGHLTVDYRASDDVNLYARAARGYRTGGFNARQSTSVANNIGLLPFNEEKITSYEFGAKTQLIPGLTLNGAIFYNIYEDQQATVPIPIVGGGSFGTQIVNAGKTKYLGAELEARWQITDAFSIDGSFGYVDSKTKEFPSADINGVIQNIASEFRPGNSPSTTANAGITYSAPIGSGDTRLTARVGASHVSSIVFFGNPLTSPFQQETKGGARTLVDAQLRLDDVNLGGAEFSVQLWGKNILNKKYVSRGIDFGQLGFGSVIYGDPATYGLSLEFEF
ncbi:MAG: TonB-dependent receptor, partial [Parasphingorhabdus sp.]